MKRPLTVCVLLILWASFCVAQTSEEEINVWRKNRLEKLTAEDGWVTLAGLFWLREGENSFGRSPENHLIANYAEFPEKVGAFISSKGSVTFTARPETDVLCNHKPVTSIQLVSDQDGKPTILQYKTFSWYLIKRGELLGIRMKWSEHPNRKRLLEIPAYPISAKWRIKGRYIPYSTPKKLMIPSVIGTESEEDCPGEIHLTLNNHPIVLYPTGSRDSLSLIFSDASNGKETYAGGRFLPLPRPDESNEIILDFNKAYNPPCVFTPFATCPIPIPENNIELPIESGEKMVHLFVH